VTLCLRVESTSGSILARAHHRHCELLVMFEARKVCQKWTTLSSTFSSHRLPLSLSDARMRMSLVCMGSVTICTMPGSVQDVGPSCSGGLNWGEGVKEIKSGRGMRVTHSPPHLAVLYNIIPTD
jgi:hypothetical protein